MGGGEFGREMKWDGPQYYPNTQQPITDMTSTFAFAHVVGVIILTSKQNPTWHRIIVDSTRNTLDEKENTEGMTLRGSSCCLQVLWCISRLEVVLQCKNLN